MASKKLTLLIGLICLFMSYAKAQDVGNSYDIRDSSLIPTKRLAQHNEFLNNAYPFPAKPRNEWEIGVKGGYTSGFTSVTNWGPTGGFGFHVRKAIGYMFSVRAEYDWIRLRGLNYQYSQSYGKNPSLTQADLYPELANASYSPIFYNYRSTIHELSLQGLWSIHNVNFHRAKVGWNAYLFGGVALLTYSTLYKQDASYLPGYANVIAEYPNETSKYKKDIRSALKNVLTGNWNHIAERPAGASTLGGAPLNVAGVAGVGFQFKVSTKLNIALEDKVTLTTTGLLDGQQWQNNFQQGSTQAIAALGSKDRYNFVSLGLNYNIFGKHAVEPLWWINPLDYAYNEINAPRHMKLPKPVLDDTDGDGVTDQFDLEPNTPKGCPVDTHGVSRDTDGDGVPDCKDKELITPTQCQPVDADGVGKCPDPQCCKDLRNYIDSLGLHPGTGKCGIGDLPSITFKGRSVTLSKDNKALLSSTAQKLRDNPNCKIAVIGYGESSKAAQQLSWDRVNAVINYLVEKEGVSSDRFIFRYAQSGGEENTVDLKDGTGEEGPNTVPAPHPNLRSH
jgi:outer membrane protein OmpA-like peptidoglycan-associated protein